MISRYPRKFRIWGGAALTGSALMLVADLEEGRAGSASPFWATDRLVMHSHVIANAKFWWLYC